MYGKYPSDSGTIIERRRSNQHHWRANGNGKWKVKEQS